MRTSLLFSLPLVLLAGGCVQAIAESRVRSALLEAGAPPSDADCMSQRMVDRLTVEQLRKLEGSKARPGEAERPANLDEFVARLRRVGDEEVVAVTASSAALCRTGLANEAR